MIELFFAQGTDEKVKRAAQNYPPYDLLKAYRDAQAAFNTNDIVLVVTDGQPEGLAAYPRSAYIAEAFRQWGPERLKIHPVSEPARKKLKVPQDLPAWWFAMQFPDSGAIVFCAIGAFSHVIEAAAN